MPMVVAAGEWTALTRNTPRPAPHSPSQTRGRGSAAPAPMLRLCACVRRPPFTAQGAPPRPAARVSSGLDQLPLYTEGTSEAAEGRIVPNRDRCPTLPGNPPLSQNEFYPRGHRQDISGGPVPPPGDPARLRPHLGREVVRSIGIVGDVVLRGVRRAAGSAVRMRLP